MGSGLGAGGACLYAAHKGQGRIDIIPPDIIEVFFQQVLPLRWVDDALYVLLERLTPEVEQVLRDVTHEGFYGGGLRLLQQDGNEASGFLFEVRNNIIQVRQSPKHIRKLDDQCFEQEWSSVPGDNTFQSHRVSVGVVSGYFARLFDMTNETACGAKAQVSRLIWGIRSVHIPPDTIRRGYAKIRSQLWQNISEVEKHMWVTPHMAAACAACADASALVLSTAESMHT